MCPTIFSSFRLSQTVPLLFLSLSDFLCYIWSFYSPTKKFFFMFINILSFNTTSNIVSYVQAFWSVHCGNVFSYFSSLSVNIYDWIHIPSHFIKIYVFISSPCTESPWRGRGFVLLFRSPKRTPNGWLLSSVENFASVPIIVIIAVHSWLKNSFSSCIHSWECETWWC